jgi:hypothetical protein
VIPDIDICISNFRYHWHLGGSSVADISDLASPLCGMRPSGRDTEVAPLADLLVRGSLSLPLPSRPRRSRPYKGRCRSWTTVTPFTGRALIKDGHGFALCPLSLIKDAPAVRTRSLGSCRTLTPAEYGGGVDPLRGETTMKATDAAANWAT